MQLRDREERLRLGDLALIMPHELHGYRTADTSEVFICVFSQDYVDTFVQSIKGLRGRQSVFQCPQGLNGYLEEIFFHTLDPDWP